MLLRRNNVSYFYPRLRKSRVAMLDCCGGSRDAWIARPRDPGSLGIREPWMLATYSQPSAPSGCKPGGPGKSAVLRRRNCFLSSIEILSGVSWIGCIHVKTIVYFYKQLSPQKYFCGTGPVSNARATAPLGRRTPFRQFSAGIKIQDMQ